MLSAATALQSIAADGVPGTIRVDADVVGSLVRVHTVDACLRSDVGPIAQHAEQALEDRCHRGGSLQATPGPRYDVELKELKELDALARAADTLQAGVEHPPAAAFRVVDYNPQESCLSVRLEALLRRRRR